MTSLPTLIRAISAKRSLPAVTAPNITALDVLLTVITAGIYAGLYAIYHHLYSDSENQLRSYAEFSDLIANEEDWSLSKSVANVKMISGIITLSVVELGGKQRIQVAINNLTAYLDATITTLKQVQDRIREDIRQDQDTYKKFDVTFSPSVVSANAVFKAASRPVSDQDESLIILNNDEICLENVLSAERQDGGDVSQVTKVTYKNGEVFFFKPSDCCYSPDRYVSAAGISGIPRKNSRYEYRSLFTYLLSRDLGFDVIPETVLTSVFTKQNPSVPGYAQKMVPGTSFFHAILECRRHGLSSFNRFLRNPVIIRKFFELQLLDALTGQADRHAGNIYIDFGSNGVFGIDNDVCGGEFVTHPHNMLTVIRSDGYGRNGTKLSVRETKILDHLKKQYVRLAGTVKKGESTGGKAVLLPPIMDRDMVKKFKGLKANALLSRMASLHFTESEQRAACFRLEAIKDHIRVLELRNSKSILAIINPEQWSSPTVIDKLFHKFEGKNLTIAASYLQRDLSGVVGFRLKKSIQFSTCG